MPYTTAYAKNASSATTPAAHINCSKPNFWSTYDVQAQPGDYFKVEFQPVLKILEKNFLEGAWFFLVEDHSGRTETFRIPPEEEEKEMILEETIKEAGGRGQKAGGQS